MGNSNKYKIIFFIILALDALLIAAVILAGAHLNFALLSPKGVIAQKERAVIFEALLLMLIVVVPVFAATLWITIKYRAGNSARSDYQPEWSGNKKLQFAWWAYPGTIIVFLAALTWHSSHALDPFKPLSSDNKPVTIEVVALNWKWLFIYPEQNIASVNFLEFPKNTPLNFMLTADAPMNSFWIPELGGQMYAMAGMSTQLHLMADQEGEFNGGAAEINGKGFAGMHFKAKSVSDSEFAQWVQSVQKSAPILSVEDYKQLVKPSMDNPPVFYSPISRDLYGAIIGKYVGPQNSMPGMNMNMDMNMSGTTDSSSTGTGPADTGTDSGGMGTDPGVMDPNGNIIY